MKFNIKTFFYFLVSFVFLSVGAKKTSLADVGGFGVSSCKTYLETDALELSFLAWAQGYISALDAIKHHNFSPGRQSGLLFNFIRNFCLKNPEKSYLEGVDAFVGQVLKKYVPVEPVEAKPVVLPLNFDDRYKTIEISMSQIQVQKILGKPDSRVAASTEKGVFDCWRWFYGNGSRDHALIFLNKKVVQLGITSCPFWLENVR